MRLCVASLQVAPTKGMQILLQAAKQQQAPCTLQQWHSS